MLASSDAPCVVELAVLEGLLGEPGVKMLQGAIIQCLPTIMQLKEAPHVQVSVAGSEGRPLDS
eukprot:3088029-Prorocentrum_lima.AAC.1